MKINIGPYLDNKDRNIEVKIHNYDLWNLDATLSIVIYEALKEFKKFSCHFFVNNEDLPEELYYKDLENWRDKDHQKRIDFIFDEMLFAFGEIKEGNYMTAKCIDKSYSDRIQNGLNLFAKHFMTFWT